MNKRQLEREIVELQKQLEEKQKALASAHDKWEPEGGNYYVTSSGGISSGESVGWTCRFGLEYATREQAEKAAKAMRAHNRLLAYVAEFAPDWEPDWLDEHQLKAGVIFSALNGEWVVDYAVICFNPSAVYMPECVAEDLAAKLNSGEVEL